MSKKEDLVSKIIEREWDMFQNVNNIGGKASCQQNYQTFETMRYSQAMSWSEDTLESYLEDLQDAQKNERNLLTEKYARMMESTSPLEYVQIEDLLPPLDPEVLEIIDQIVTIMINWEEEVIEKYPYVARRGRPLRSSEDTLFATSIETYLRAELSTYSLKTLKLYLENVLKQKAENINGSELIHINTAKRYGYKSLQEANEKLKNRSSR
jgi:hypothetical protein